MQYKTIEEQNLNTAMDVIKRIYEVLEKDDSPEPLEDIRGIIEYEYDLEGSE